MKKNLILSALFLVSTSSVFSQQYVQKMQEPDANFYDIKKSFDDYWTPYLSPDGPAAEYAATLDATKRERLQNLVRASYLDGEPDGPRSYAAVAWAVAGVVPS